MGLLDVPPEIFARITHSLVDAIGPNQAWKLRQVCKTFAAYIDDDIFSEQPLHALSRPYDGNPEGLSAFELLRSNFARFLYSRTHQLLDVHPHLPSSITRVADFLISLESVGHINHTPQKRNEIILKLCNAAANNLGEIGMMDFLGYGRLRHRIYPGGSISIHYLENEPLGPDMTRGEQDLSDKFVAAAALGNYDAIEACLQSGALTWTHSAIFGSALWTALIHDKENTVAFLLSKFPKNIMGRTEGVQFMHMRLDEVIVEAFKAEKIGLVTILLEWFGKHLPACRQSYYTNFLSKAMITKDQKAVAAALTVRTTSRDRFPWEIVRNARKLRYAPTIRTLVEQGGFNVDKIWWKTTSLNEAVKWGQIEMARELLLLGADPNGPSIKKNGELVSVNSPMLTAVEQNEAGCLELLLEHGGKLNGPHHNRNYLLGLANNRGKETNIFKMLADAEGKEKAQKASEAKAANILQKFSTSTDPASGLVPRKTTISFRRQQ